MSGPPSAAFTLRSFPHGCPRCRVADPLGAAALVKRQRSQSACAGFEFEVGEPRWHAPNCSAATCRRPFSTERHSKLYDRGNPATLRGGIGRLVIPSETVNEQFRPAVPITSQAQGIELKAVGLAGAGPTSVMAPVVVFIVKSVKLAYRNRPLGSTETSWALALTETPPSTTLVTAVRRPDDASTLNP